MGSVLIFQCVVTAGAAGSRFNLLEKIKVLAGKW